jgi:type IV pilus assembly protein PilP
MKLKKSHHINLIGMLALSAVLYGCGNSHKRKELEAYVQRVESRSIKEIEPLPELKPYDTFTYAATNVRSPFIPSLSEDLTKKVSATGNGIHPDVNRHKEALESFPLDSLRMVGTLEKDKKRWALIVDPSGTVYRLTRGNFVGQNHGHIESVDDEKVVINEIVPDPSGGWRERKASIALVDDQHKHQQNNKEKR